MNDFRVGDRVQVRPKANRVGDEIMWAGKTGRVFGPDPEWEGSWFVELDDDDGLTRFSADELEPETPATPTITVPDTAGKRQAGVMTRLIEQVAAIIWPYHLTVDGRIQLSDAQVEQTGEVTAAVREHIAAEIRAYGDSHAAGYADDGEYQAYRDGIYEAAAVAERKVK